MVALYCQGQHAPEPGTLCTGCRALLDYALQRLGRCPFQGKKPTCANCPIHCYQPERREQIRAVMRYAGPRMLLQHPGLAILHLLDGVRRPSPIHMDFHPGNVLLRDDGSAVVIDWTGFDISDSRFDLAWTLLLVSTHEDEEWRDLVLQEYERQAGIRVEQRAYFDVAACARRLFSVVLSLSEGPEKLGMRAGAVTMMKQQMGSIKRVHGLLQERAGIRVPEVDRLLAQFSWKRSSL